jgi:hypothetical protein
MRIESTYRISLIFFSNILGALAGCWRVSGTRVTNDRGAWQLRAT